MVDVTPVRAPARQLLPEQLGALTLDRHALVKLGHVSLLVLLKHAGRDGSFCAGCPISPIACSDAAYKLE
jgi:hypothetical protein